MTQEVRYMSILGTVAAGERQWDGSCGRKIKPMDGMSGCMQPTCGQHAQRRLWPLACACRVLQPASFMSLLQSCGVNCTPNFIYCIPWQMATMSPGFYRQWPKIVSRVNMLNGPGLVLYGIDCVRHRLEGDMLLPILTPLTHSIYNR